MHRIVVATANSGKLREIQEMLADLSIEALPQRALGISDADETGLSFVENAIIKARHASTESGLAALADDSGLMVDALHGEPGIYSARYAGHDATDWNNLQKLLSALAEVPEGARTARFKCVLAYMAHASDPAPIVCCGTWEGRILFEPRGENGFGYDPIFEVPEHNCSAAELSPDTKNVLSHRGQAVRKLVDSLARELSRND
jgi:XTP/dITP diphosphohydrolase